MFRFDIIRTGFIIFISLIISTQCWGAGTTPRQNDTKQCMIVAMESDLFDHLTIGELRQQCATHAGRSHIEATIAGTTSRPTQKGLIDQRLIDEQQTRYHPFTLTAHRRNYILPLTYNHNTNGKPFDVDNKDVKNVEVKFQFSFKFPLWNNIIGDADLWGAYTNLSFWQAYNATHSNPFRETNHEPELFLSFQGKREILGFKNSHNTLGIVHQSNGRNSSRSRSWNRVYLNMAFEQGNFAFAIKPWYRIPEDDKNSSTDPSGDDNPDIDKYMGYGELSAGYKWNEHLLSMMLRNNLRSSGNKGAIQLDWTFPLTRRIKGYVQYFNGYGESLIDYNASVNRVGVGIVLTDAL